MKNLIWIPKIIVFCIAFFFFLLGFIVQSVFLGFEAGREACDRTVDKRL